PSSRTRPSSPCCRRDAACAACPSRRSSLFSLPRPPPRSPLFPYTTLFRSHATVGAAASGALLAGLGVEAPGAYAARTLGVYDERSEEHTSELQSLRHLVCRLLLEKKKRRTPASSPRPKGRPVCPSD